MLAHPLLKGRIFPESNIENWQNIICTFGFDDRIALFQATGLRLELEALRASVEPMRAGDQTESTKPVAEASLTDQTCDISQSLCPLRPVDCHIGSVRPCLPSFRTRCL